MTKITLAIKIYRLQLAFVRTVNDTHIFVQQAIPQLAKISEKLNQSSDQEDRKYFVPAVGKTKFAQRTDDELKEIYDRFISRELFENFITSLVSQYESFLFDVLRLIITAYPYKLTRNIRGVEFQQTLPLTILLEANTKEEVIEEFIKRRINEISYARPRDYLEYLGNIACVDTSDEAFLDYIEIKATRDLIIHNSCVVNQVYISKVANKRRGEIGQRLEINAEYFDHCIATLKRIAGIIKRDTEKEFKN